MIEADIKSVFDDFKSVQEISYDTWTFPRDQMHRWVEEYNWPMASRAKAEYTVPATEAFADKVGRGLYVHDGCPILKTALKNTRIKNYQGGRRPDKDPSRSMIDPLMALIYLTSGIIEAGHDRPSVYESPNVAV